MSIPAEDLLSEEPIEGYFPVTDNSGNPACTLNIRMHYKSKESIAGSNDVQETVCPMKTGKDFLSHFTL